MAPQVTAQQHFTQPPSVISTAPGRSPWHNNNPFVVLPLTAKVKKCSGCHVLFRDPMGPPFIGLVVQHKEKDVYTDKTGVRRLSNEANHYYHCQFACIAVRHPYFHAGYLQIGPGTLIDSAQASEIRRQFGVNLA